jgi:hypothetical protein
VGLGPDAATRPTTAPARRRATAAANSAAACRLGSSRASAASTAVKTEAFGWLESDRPARD